MCDEAKLRNWAREAIDRRRFGAIAGAAVAAACTPGTPGGSNQERRDPGGSMFSTIASIETPSGTMDGFIVYPEQGARYPGVIFWPDIAGIRRAMIEMAMRLASHGYAVLIANPYYRDVQGEQFSDFADFIDTGGFEKVRPWREKLTADAIQSDARAIAQWLDAQEQVDASRGLGTQGYCMGGPFAIWSAAAVPDRVRAAASFHGGGLVRRGDPMSPHKLLDEVDARLLIAIARDDDAEDPQAKEILAEAAKAADVPALIKVYEGDHGWTVPDSPAFAESAAEEAFADLLELYSNTL